MAQRPKVVPLPTSSGRTVGVGVSHRITRWSRAVLLDPILAILIFGTLFVALMAYQPQVRLARNLAAQPTDVRLTGVYPSEGLGSAAQRWTTERATLRFVGVGAGNYTVVLRFHGGAEAGAGRTLAVNADGGTTPLAQLPVRPNWQEVAFLVPPSAVDAASGDLALTLEVPPMRGAADDPRKLGVALSHVTLTPAETDFRVVLPPGRRTFQLLLTVILAFAALRLVRVSSRTAGLAAGTLVIVWGLAIVWARVDAVLLLDIAQRILPWTVIIAAVLYLFSRLTSPVSRVPAAVSCAVLLIFALRFGGLLHPQYIMIDQKLRANQLVNIAAGRVELVRPQLEQQYEWGTREPVPYSLITYDMLVPLTWFFKDDDLVKAIAATSALLDATVPLLLWMLLRETRDRRQETEGRKGDVESSLVALCYAALPVGYLFFHDGSFPTTIGLWFVVVALVAVRWLAERQGTGDRRQETARQGEIQSVSRFTALQLIAASLAIGLALVAYVTHLAFVPFLVGAVAASLWVIGGERRAAKLTALTLVLALFGAWIVYYREYTVTLIQRTIPAFIQQIAERGSVGRDTDLLYATAVNTPFEHIYAHFRVWPVALASMALLLLLLFERKRFATHLGLAYGLFFLATLVAEQWFGLWNKHMAFVAPGLALLSGIGLAYLWRRGLPGRLICIVLLGFLFWESTIAWGNRVLWYVLPANAL